jgi:hypothetical protein
MMLLLIISYTELFLSLKIQRYKLKVPPETHSQAESPPFPPNCRLFPWKPCCRVEFSCIKCRVIHFIKTRSQGGVAHLNFSSVWFVMILVKAFVSVSMAISTRSLEKKRVFKVDKRYSTILRLERRSIKVKVLQKTRQKSLRLKGNRERNWRQSVHILGTREMAPNYRQWRCKHSGVFFLCHDLLSLF